MNILGQKFLLLSEPALCAAGSLISPQGRPEAAPFLRSEDEDKGEKKIPKTLSNVPWRESNLPMRSTDTYWCGEQTNSCLEVGERRTQDYQGAAKTSTGYNCIIFIHFESFKGKMIRIEIAMKWGSCSKKKKKVTWRKEIRTPISKKQNKLDCWTNSPELCSQYSWVLMSKF